MWIPSLLRWESLRRHLPHPVTACRSHEISLALPACMSRSGQLPGCFSGSSPEAANLGVLPFYRGASVRTIVWRRILSSDTILPQVASIRAETPQEQLLLLDVHESGESAKAAALAAVLKLPSWSSAAVECCSYALRLCTWCWAQNSH